MVTFLLCYFISITINYKNFKRSKNIYKSYNDSNYIEIKKIIRICRTWPTKKFGGVGLHAYNYSKYVDIPTDVFVKDIDSNDIFLDLKNVSFIHVKYEDILLSRTNSKLKYFLILITKLKGEIKMFFALLNSVDKRLSKESILHIHSANYLIGGF